MAKDINYLDSRKYKQIMFLYFPRDSKNLGANSYITITGERIEKDSFSLTEYVNSGNEWKFGIGDKFVLKVKLNLKGLDYEFAKGDVIEARAVTSNYKNNDYSNSKRTPLGCFVVDTIENTRGGIASFTAYSYGIDSSEDVFNNIEMKKMGYVTYKDVNYNLPIDALALEALGFSFFGVTKSSSPISKTGSSNRTLVRFDKTSTGWKEIVLEFDYYEIGNMDKGWSKHMFKPIFFVDNTEAVKKIREYFKEYRVTSNAIDYLYNASLVDFRVSNPSISGNTTTENYTDECLGESYAFVALIKPKKYVYGDNPHMDSMSGYTNILIPTGVSIWQISGTTGTKTATRLYQKTTKVDGSTLSMVEEYILRNTSEYITLKKKAVGGVTSEDSTEETTVKISEDADEVYADIKTEDILNAYCEFTARKLVVNRNYSHQITSQIEYPYTIYEGKYNDSWLFPEDELFPSPNLYPAEGDDFGIIPIGKEMSSSLRIDVNSQMHKYGGVIIPDYQFDEENNVIKRFLRAPDNVIVNNDDQYSIYDRRYDMFENLYIKLKKYNLEQVKSQLVSNGFWSRITKINDSPICALKSTGLPFLTAGEFVNVYDGNNYIPIMINQRTIKGEQGMMDDIVSKPLQSEVDINVISTVKY